MSVLDPLLTREDLAGYYAPRVEELAEKIG